MTRDFLQKLLDSGEGFTIEYKKNENKLSTDVFETISSFSNPVTVTAVMFCWG